MARLRWQCRRGTLELDLLLRQYLETGYLSAGQQEQQLFEQLLKLEDTELLPYFMGEKRPKSDKLAALVEKIRS